MSWNPEPSSGVEAVLKLAATVPSKLTPASSGPSSAPLLIAPAAPSAVNRNEASAPSTAMIRFVPAISETSTSSSTAVTSEPFFSSIMLAADTVDPSTVSTTLPSSTRAYVLPVGAPATVTGVPPTSIVAADVVVLMRAAADPTVNDMPIAGIGPQDRGTEHCRRDAHSGGGRREAGAEVGSRDRDNSHRSG